MISYLFTNPLAFFFWILALIVAITIHEFAHAYTADRLGDPTPRLQGRLTLNPLAHLDPLGTLMLFIFRFGWGKPVQFDPYNLANPKRDAALISLAGPASNLLLAALFSLLLRWFGSTPLLSALLLPFILLNVVLAIFNLLPIHPLDGFKIVGGLLPQHKYQEWLELERYGLFILLLLLFPLGRGGPLITQLITPPINLILHLLLPTPINF